MYKTSKDKVGDVICKSFVSGCLGCGTALLMLFLGAVWMQKTDITESGQKMIYGISVLFGSLITSMRLNKNIRTGHILQAVSASAATLITLWIITVFIGKGGAKYALNPFSIGMSFVGSILGALPYLLKSNKTYRSVIKNRKKHK